MKHTVVFLTGLLLLAAGATNSRAAVTITAVESGGDVVFTGSGTLNLVSLTYITIVGTTPSIQPDVALIILGSVSGSGSTDAYSGVTAPSAFGTGVFLQDADSGSGDVIGTDPIGFLFVPFGYFSGNALSASNTYTGETVASLGMTPGTYTWTWGSGGNADSLTLDIVPEASRALLSLIAIAGVGLRRRR